MRLLKLIYEKYGSRCIEHHETNQYYVRHFSYFANEKSIIQKAGIKAEIMKIIFIGFLSSLTLIGCATTSQYKTKLSTLVGQPESVLIAKWGEPTGRYTDESGDEVIAYIRSREVMMPSTPSYTVVSGGGTTGMPYNSIVRLPELHSSSTGTSGGSIQLSCMTKFVMKNGVVSASTFKGNDCKSRN